jgi:hypothetical protein
MGITGYRTQRHFLLAPVAAKSWLEICGSIKDPNHCEVRTAVTKIFGPDLS